MTPPAAPSSGKHPRLAGTEPHCQTLTQLDALQVDQHPEGPGPLTPAHIRALQQLAKIIAEIAQHPATALERASLAMQCHAAGRDTTRLLSQGGQGIACRMSNHRFRAIDQLEARCRR